jgi:thiamine biosynthesis lipoprotein
MQASEIRVQSFGKSCRVLVDDSNGSELLALCQEELRRLEGKFSAFDPESVISRVNQSAGTGAFVELDAEAASLFDFIDVLWSESKHQFDPTVRILEECYDDTGNLRASQQQLQGMARLVGLQHLERKGNRVHLSHKGMLLDLNGCVRPYAVDSLRKLLSKRNVQHALIEIGQDVATLGKQPGGANWLIGIRLPKGSAAAISRIKLNNRAFALRGDFERTSTREGERYGRALSPVDGQPIPGLLSVGVSADSCLAACSAASIARMKTEESALRWLDSLDMPWVAIDRQLYCHGPLANR